MRKILNSWLICVKGKLVNEGWVKAGREVGLCYLPDKFYGRKFVFSNGISCQKLECINTEQTRLYTFFFPTS